MTPLLVALLLSSNASGKTLVRTNPGTTVPISGFSGPLILDDANTVVHVRWNGSSLVDSRGSAWAMTGTVPQVARAAPVPAGSGPYSTSNYYGVAAPNALNLSGDMMVCAVFRPTSIADYGVIVSNWTSAAGGTGWVFFWWASTGRMRFYTSAATESSAAVLTNQINVSCGGRNGTANYISLNGVTTGTTAYAYTAGANAGRIGFRGDAVGPVAGTIYEVFVTATPYTDAAALAIMASIKAKLGITAW